MDHSQREMRRAAAQAFSQSLEQLAGCLKPELNSTGHKPSQPPEKSQAEPDAMSRQAMSLKDLEEAAADIERLFMQIKN